MNLRCHDKRQVRDQSVEDVLLLSGLDNKIVDAVVNLTNFLVNKALCPSNDPELFLECYNVTGTQVEFVFKQLDRLAKGLN